MYLNLRYFYIIIQLFYFSGQPRSSLETKKNLITDDYTISQTVLGLGINGKGGLISEDGFISVKSSIRFEPKMTRPQLNQDRH